MYVPNFGPSRREKLAKRKTWCSACRGDQHKLCTGKRRVPHVGTAKCECPRCEVSNMPDPVVTEKHIAAAIAICVLDYEENGLQPFVVNRWWRYDLMMRQAEELARHFPAQPEREQASQSCPSAFTGPTMQEAADIAGRLLSKGIGIDGKDVIEALAPWIESRWQAVR